MSPTVRSRPEKFSFLSRNKKTKCLYISKFCVFLVFHKTQLRKSNDDDHDDDNEVDDDAALLLVIRAWRTATIDGRKADI